MYFEPTFKNSGISRTTYNLLRGLSKIDKQNEYHVFVKRESYRSEFDKKNFTTHLTNWNIENNYLRPIWEQIVMPIRYLKYDVDILHSTFYNIPCINYTPAIFTVHDLTTLLYPRLHASWNKNIYLDGARTSSIKKAKKIIAISEATKKDIINLFGKKINKLEEKIVVIYLGVNKISKSIIKNSTIKEKYGINSPFLLYVGNLEPRKNIPGLIKAFYKLKKKRYPHKLIIIGDKGWLYNEIFYLIKKYNLNKEIIHLGYLSDEDISEFYNTADLFVYPSYMKVLDCQY